MAEIFMFIRVEKSRMTIYFNWIVMYEEIWQLSKRLKYIKSDHLAQEAN